MCTGNLPVVDWELLPKVDQLKSNDIAPPSNCAGSINTRNLGVRYPTSVAGQRKQSSPISPGCTAPSTPFHSNAQIRLFNSMSALKLSKTSAGQARGAFGQVKRRWIHGSLKRQGILMPAMSPLMTEGTITRWKKREGEAFEAGDVLLQIESDLYMVDVEAQCPGILGKILIPDGTSNVPVEQLIALVARDTNELAVLQNQSNLPLPPALNSLPVPPSTSASSPRQSFKPLSSPRTPTMSSRTPSLFEMHTMGYGQRNAHIGGPRGTIPKPLESLGLDTTSEIRVAMSPCLTPQWLASQTQTEVSSPFTPSTTKWPASGGDVDQFQTEGAALRRMIVSNLSQSSRGVEIEDWL
ncbi:Pyruvate dehydrogenase protein X component, mitochondrial [Psilocybe cubensis]|uniref:Pyruvate dehydrogenase protein X component, mitochondrial n=2 Tax=Psilocybe cubensis TaxID=181762 RepID=A0ACB8H8P7_PSICU|nr:Pyruvate dehydrogenase protein X component, mitochondrial [Psilocybe cubensis]KAH9484079.1 Pyruvate dehydrogenase protein X component, mitochondrial [Psilocybe cubensis]